MGGLGVEELGRGAGAHEGDPPNLRMLQQRRDVQSDKTRLVDRFTRAVAARLPQLAPLRIEVAHVEGVVVSRRHEPGLPRPRHGLEERVELTLARQVEGIAFEDLGEVVARGDRSIVDHQKKLSLTMTRSPSRSSMSSSRPVRTRL